MRHAERTAVDFHTHILPGIDDGSASVEESLEMLRLLAAQGVRAVVATPHFYPDRDRPDRFLARRAAAEEKLRAAMAELPGLPELHIGAEVYFFKGISESDTLSRLTIDKKSCILLEMPESLWTESMYRELENIHGRQGVTPIIAHVDRYLSPFRTHGIPERLQELPVLVQANASFFLRPAARPLAMKLLRKGQIHLLGSDCHDLASRRPNIGPARERIQKHLGKAFLDRIDGLSAELLDD